MKQVGAVFIVRDDHLRQTISGRENRERGWNLPWRIPILSLPRVESILFALQNLPLPFDGNVANNEPALRQFVSVENNQE